MALETVKDIDFGDYIDVDQATNTVSFKLQDGPVMENGVNGCQVDDVVGFARTLTEQLNARFRCRENAVAITKLQEAEMWLRERKRDREARGVEGFDKA